MSKAKSIVRMESFPNCTPTGRSSATGARKLAMYLGYGRGRRAEQEQRAQRGQWLDQKGRNPSHQEVTEWVQQQGKENHYTHQFILSVKDFQLTPEAFNRAMAAGGGLFSEWRLICHNDSNYSHAHAVVFGKQEVMLKSEAFKEWWREVRQALEYERQHAQEQQSQLQQGQEQIRQTAQELSNEQEEERGWGLEI
jgi:hypothetical protein